jgi:hypothetical protein
VIIIEHTHQISLYDFPKHLLKFSRDPSPHALFCSIHIESGTPNLCFYVDIIVHAANLLNVTTLFSCKENFVFLIMAKQIFVLRRNVL